MDMDKLTASIQAREGLRLKPYLDTTGNLTIGYGINLSSGITQDEAAYLLGNRLQLAARAAEAQPWWTCLAGNDARERAMVEMVYNLGSAGVNSFHDAIACLEASDFVGAAAAFLDSLWHKQVGERAEIIANMILSGSG